MTSCFIIISPVSIPSAIRCVVTPVTVSPLMIAHWIGAAPRYFGSRDACTLTQPKRGISNIAFGIICPKASTIMISGSYPRRYSTQASSLTRSGWYTSMPCASAHALTGVYLSALLLPTALSGCETTSPTSCPALMISSNVATAKSGVPMNMTLMLILLPESVLRFSLHPPHTSPRAEVRRPSRCTYARPDDPAHDRWRAPKALFPQFRTLPYSDQAPLP